eukprot:scaffold6250_cov151-Isochrysis_galbana.AAC.1
MGEVDSVRDGFVVDFDHEVGCGVREGASEGPGVGLLGRGSPLLGLDLPVGDRELDWYFGEGEDDFVPILGLELLLAMGECRARCPHPRGRGGGTSDGRAHVGVADFAERWTVLFDGDGDEVVGVGDKVGVVPLLRRLLHDGRRA